MSASANVEVAWTAPPRVNEGLGPPAGVVPTTADPATLVPAAAVVTGRLVLDPVAIVGAVVAATGAIVAAGAVVAAAVGTAGDWDAADGLAARAAAVGALVGDGTGVFVGALLPPQAVSKNASTRQPIPLRVTLTHMGASAYLVDPPPRGAFRRLHNRGEHISCSYRLQ